MRSLLLLPVVLLLAGGARAEEVATWGPVPASLASVAGTVEDEALARTALATLEAEARAGNASDALLDARALLVMLSDTGLRHVGERLAADDVPPSLLPHLLHVVSEAGHPAADAFLTRAAASPRPVTRMVAADGLARGRTPGAAETLAALCRDPVPGVRGTALRALFAIDTEEAARARQALPLDPRPDLHARRLRWHRLRGRANPGLLPMARDTWEHGRTPEERLETARLIALPALAAPLDLLQDVVAELGTDALGATLRRLARGVPRHGYDRGRARLAAILAAFSCAGRGDEALRADMVDRMVGWLARPARLGPYERVVPEDVLRMVLADWGGAVREPTLARLRVNGFQMASEGVDLLLEALPEEEAAAALRSLVDPENETPVDTWVRVAAAGGLRELQQIGDESVARALVRPDEEVMIRRHAVRALARDDASWAVPLLGELLAARDPTVLDDALATLEARGDDAARALLVHHLFTRATRPEVRMRHLVEPADPLAWSVLERALSRERSSLRRAALRQLGQVAALRRSDRALELLRAYEQRVKPGDQDTHELQQMIDAYFVLAPVEGVEWMRDHWDRIEALGWEGRAIRTLQNVPAGPASERMIDLVLAKLAESERAEILREATTALEGRRGYRDEDVDAFWRRALTWPDEEVVFAAEQSVDHPGHADLTEVLIPRFERLDPSDAGVLPEAANLLDVFRYQPVERVEPLLVRLIEDTNADPALRQMAAVDLLGRISDAGRARLLDWLTSEDAGQDDEAVALRVARVVGTGGGEAVARRAIELLRTLLLDTYATPHSLDPELPPEGTHGWHIGSLACAIAYTEHEPTILDLLRLVFDDRFARYARRAVALHGRRLTPVDATSGARAGPTVGAVGHREDSTYSPVVWEVGRILENVKSAPDEMLARCLDAILSDARRTGRLAIFPDLYLDRVIAYLRERLTGDRTLAAETVERRVGMTEPARGATDFRVARERLDALVRQARYADAVDAQALALSILAQRAYDDDPVYRWRVDRAVLDAWRGAAAAAAGDAEAAEALFVRAAERHPYGAEVLGTTARARALSGIGLDTALRHARRGVQLERRLGDRVSYDNADALALVLLELGRFEEAAAAIEPILRRVERQQDPGGRYHLRAAQARVGAGDLGGARKAVLEALRLEPSLDDAMRRDPWLAPLVADGTLEALVRHAQQEALTPSVE